MPICPELLNPHQHWVLASSVRLLSHRQRRSFLTPNYFDLLITGWSSRSLVDGSGSNDTCKIFAGLAYASMQYPTNLQLLHSNMAA